MRGSIYNSYDSAKSLKKSLKKVKKKLIIGKESK